MKAERDAMAAVFKRPRGRPPTTPAKLRAYRSRTVRLRKDGRPCKAPTHITLDQLEAWLEAHAGRYWRGRGRPPAGAMPWTMSAAEHFAISRRTVLRLADALTKRRAQRARSSALDAASGGMLAALSERYSRVATVSGPPSHPAEDRLHALSAAGSPRGAAEPGAAPDDARLIDAIAAYLQDRATDAGLAQLADIIARRRAAGPTPAVGRGLEALGLQKAPPPPAVLSSVVAGVAIRSALLEALDAFAALGQEGAVSTVAQQLQRLLESPRSPIR